VFYLTLSLSESEKIWSKTTNILILPNLKTINMRKSFFPLLIALSFSKLSCSKIHAQEVTANVARVDYFIDEIYRDCPEYRDTFYVERAKDCLSRTIYHRVDKAKYPECPLLSSVSKKNKCNQDMTYNDLFDPFTFNPLKYNFKYFTSGTSYYRVDGTDYIIEIRPKTK
jgi:hypothetical protein